MKANELRALSQDDLAVKEKELTQELFNIRFQLHTGRLENTAKIDAVRKDIARVKTILQEKRG
ncbi:50S ribosomal protein L29 [Geobacter argillaceus]|jgi:large subunit ribosomal protein L29|uniref:Large ribosomal subunit protein uL29 n=1 Tax=Geobacter argillaceus TaxID=345631 RepID=A0A562VK68_9BACT|nr:50S ribosomal protein L29 [Geobacter argillaceus]TWJ18329.1 LSU ribosomal protein L29P [Geobacter argillaceus]